MEMCLGSDRFDYGKIDSAVDATARLRTEPFVRLTIPFSAARDLLMSLVLYYPIHHLLKSAHPYLWMFMQIP